MISRVDLLKQNNPIRVPNDTVTDDTDWTPGSRYLGRKLHKGNVSPDLPYRLRSRATRTQESDAEVDLPFTPDVVTSASAEPSSNANTEPTITPLKHSYNLRSRTLSHSSLVPLADTTWFMCVTGVMQAWGVAKSVQPEPRVFDKGLVFIKETEIPLSGDRWTVAVNIAVDDYSSLILGLKLVLNQTKRSIHMYKTPNAATFDLQWEEIDRLDKVVAELSSDVGSFTPLLAEEVPTPRTVITKSARSKRSLVNVLGYGLKYPFGTANAKDVLRLTRVCDELHVFEAQVAHSTEQQLTYLRSLDDNTRQNAKDIIYLTKTLRDSITNFSLQLYRTDSNLVDTQKILEKLMRYSAAIREIELAIFEAKFSLTQLQESLDLTSLEKLSSTLINPFNLSSILQQVSLQLPEGMTKLTGITVQEMYVYYAVAVVHVVPTSKGIRLFIEIPLKTVDHLFEL